MWHVFIKAQPFYCQLDARSFKKVLVRLPAPPCIALPSELLSLKCIRLMLSMEASTFWATVIDSSCKPPPSQDSAQAHKVFPHGFLKFPFWTDPPYQKICCPQFPCLPSYLHGSTALYLDYSCLNLGQETITRQKVGCSWKLAYEDPFLQLSTPCCSLPKSNLLMQSFQF